MTLRLTLFLLLFLPFTKAAYSQNKADSLKLIWQNEQELDSIRFRALNKYCSIHMFSRPDSTLLVTDYHYGLAQEKKSTEQMIWALNNKANIYRVHRKKLDTAMILYNEAENLATRLNNPIIKATLQGNKGNVYVVQQDYLNATQYYANALKTFQEGNNEKGEGRMLNNLGGVYLTIGDYDLALEYYNKSFVIFNKRDPESRKTMLVFMNIGWIYFNQKKYTESISSYKKALEIAKLKTDDYFVAACYNSLARVYYKSGQFDQAYIYAEKSLKINTDISDEIGVLESSLTLAKLTFETDIEAARIKGEAIVSKLKETTDKDIKRDIYKLLYKCYKKEDKIRLALQMHELSTIYNDSLQSETNNFAVAREVFKNDFEIKLYENKLENARAETVLKLKQLKSTFIIISVSVLLIMFIILYFRSNTIKNRKKRDLLLEELEKLKNTEKSNLIVNSNKFELDRQKIQASIGRKLNETDWTVLTIILDNPVIPNKEIAERAFMSVDGIGSSLRRMYDYFEIKDTKYKKISLLTNSIKRSNSA